MDNQRQLCLFKFHYNGKFTNIYKKVSRLKTAEWYNSSFPFKSKNEKRMFSYQFVCQEKNEN